MPEDSLVSLMSELARLSSPRSQSLRYRGAHKTYRQMHTSVSFYAAVNNLPQTWVHAVLREFVRAS